MSYLLLEDYSESDDFIVSLFALVFIVFFKFYSAIRLHPAASVKKTQCSVQCVLFCNFPSAVLQTLHRQVPEVS